MNLDEKFTEAIVLTSDDKFDAITDFDLLEKWEREFSGRRKNLKEIK